MMNKVYQPISCTQHDKYEIAIMQRKNIRIKWLDENGEYHVDSVLAKDILVKNKEEFLVASTQDKKMLSIRLDKISLLES